MMIFMLYFPSPWGLAAGVGEGGWMIERGVGWGGGCAAGALAWLLCVLAGGGPS